MTDREKQIFDKYGNYDFPTDIKQKEHNTATTQIEEMAKLDIEESGGFYSAYINDMRISKNKPLSVSKTIMSFDCPKKYISEAIGIPEGAVVLTSEEMKHPTRTEVIEFFVNHNAQVRKETAREIYKEINHLIIKDRTTPIWIKKDLLNSQSNTV